MNLCKIADEILVDPKEIVAIVYDNKLNHSGIYLRNKCEIWCTSLNPKQIVAIISKFEMEKCPDDY